MVAPVHDPPAGAATFRHQIVVTAEDIDALGHASNVAYVRWMQIVAEAHSVSVGWDHARYVEHGAVFVVRRHEVDYLRPVHEGEALELSTWIDGWKAASSVRRTCIRQNGVEVARAATTWALVSLSDGRPKRIDELLRRAFLAVAEGA
jgi:acyl-CoA thioester hydrolase